MIEFHFCDNYKTNIKKLQQDQQDSIRNKILEYKKRDNLKNISSLEDLGGEIYLLRVRTPESRIIIQEKELEIQEEKVKVFFVRDFINNIKFDRESGRLWYGRIKRGEWLQENELKQEDIVNFRDEYVKEKNTPTKLLEFPPQSLTHWLDQFQLELNNEVFEMEEWVAYAQNNSNGMLDKYVYTFRQVLEEIVNREQNNEFEIINNENNLMIYQYEKHSIGILFSKTTIANKEYIILFHGANIEEQKDYWKQCITSIKSKPVPSISNYEDLSRLAFRSYPKWTLKNNDLWFKIEKSDENGNLSLTNEQIIFLNDFKFPRYISGQAGSGKSTLLYYIFANTIYHKYMDNIKGDIIFLTENEQLLNDTRDNVFNLLEQNVEFGLEEETNNYSESFKSFKEFLLNLLDEEDKEKFRADKYLHFPVFKVFYKNTPKIKASVKDKYSAEEAWFVIVTYIYGYDTNKKITNIDYEGIDRDAKKIEIDRFKTIEQDILPFYDDLLADGYWDKLKIIRFINEKVNLDIKPKYDVIVCDEAQDFCRVELNFILRQSNYLQYDLSELQQVPIVFAGDSNQTVNPTGFRDAEMTSLLYKELQLIANFKYDNENIVYSPKLNYRSIEHVVNLANFIQSYRVKHSDITQKHPQESKRPNQNIDDSFNIFFSYETLNSNNLLKENLVKKLPYKICIVPVNSEEKKEYCQKSDLLNSFENVEIKTSVEAKGAEYKHVVLFGFGEYFLDNFVSLNSDNDSFQQAYFFNKLYVAITRAKNELIIIDSQDSYENFWKELVDLAQLPKQNGWEKIQSLQNKVIVYNPESIDNLIADSSKKDALENANEDKRLGEHYQNPSRLKVAASQFFRLGKENEANECLGLAEEILHSYKSAAEYYQKAKKLELVSSAYFKGRDFDDLEKIGTYISIEHDLRIILAKIMQKELVTNDEIERLSKNKNILPSLIKNLDWRDELLKTFIHFSKKLDEVGTIVEFVGVLESIAISSDRVLYETIGKIQFDLESYDKAIKAWEKTDYLDNQKYYLAKVEIYKQNNDNENIVIYLNELIRFEEQQEQIDICNEIIKLHLKSDYENFESDYYRAVYKAWLLLGDLQKIIAFGKIAEEKILYYDLEDLYRTMIVDNDIITKEVFSYLIERWTKVVVTHHNNLGKSLEEVNTLYSIQSKKYNLPYKPFTLEEVERISDLPQEANFSPSEHFSHLSIQNFRQFENLTLTDIGQFNLIVGDNNVGKTSLLEALMFMRNSKLYYENLAFAYIARNNTSLIKQDINEPIYELPKSFLNDFFRHNDTLNEIQFELQQDRNQWTYKVKTPTVEEIKKYLDKDSVIDVDDYTCMVDDKGECNIFEIPLIIKKLDPDHIINMQLIPFGKGFDRTLAKNYYDNIDRDKQKRKAFLESMRIFIPNIERITADTESGDIDIEEFEREDSILLHQYGEGANKLFRILIQITLQKGKKLLIDEIDAGIHYSHFKEFWRIILQVAKQNNVQIFTTTHNLECIQYFKEILEEEEEYQSLSRVITLRRLPDSSVKAYTRQFNEFEHELNNEFEIRAGEL